MEASGDYSKIGAAIAKAATKARDFCGLVLAFLQMQLELLLCFALMEGNPGRHDL